MTWWNVLDSSMVHMPAWPSSVEISRGLYLQQQLLMTNQITTPYHHCACLSNLCT